MKYRKSSSASRIARPLNLMDTYGATPQAKVYRRRPVRDLRTFCERATGSECGDPACCDARDPLA